MRFPVVTASHSYNCEPSDQNKRFKLFYCVKPSLNLNHSVINQRMIYATS